MQIRIDSLYCFILLLLTSPSLAAPWLPLTEGGFKLISFKDIPETKYSLEQNTFEAVVDHSSAAWILPLSSPRTVKSVAFLWQASGQPLIKDAAHERTKSGDDATLRVGLILSGSAPMVPFFAPSWIKAVQKQMLLPSDRMLYLLVDTKHSVGQKWPNPYSDSIEHIALGSTPRAESWQLAQYQPAAPLTVVGLWLMADGDNTKTAFKVRMKDLQLD